MIKFFRKIRRQLLTENKVTRYLIYAVGEILLVIIGILIALQVNNLNEDRKERSQESYFLSKLESNILEDIDLIDACSVTNTDFIAQHDTMLMMIQNPEQYDRIHFGEKLTYIRNFRTFVPVKVTFDNLVASGKMSILQNQELVEKLFLYYRSIEQYANSGASALASYTRNFYGPYLLQFDYWDNYDTPGSTTMKLKHNYDFDVNRKSIREFRDDPFIVNAINTKIAQLERHIEVYNDIKENASEILKEIRSELKH